MIKNCYQLKQQNIFHKIALFPFKYRFWCVFRRTQLTGFSGDTSWKSPCMQVESLISHRSNVHLSKTFLDDYIRHFRTEKEKTGSTNACQEQLSDKLTYTLSGTLNHWKLSGRHKWLHLKPGSISFWTCTAFMISQFRMMRLQAFLLLVLSHWAALFQGKCFYIVLKVIFL